MENEEFLRICKAKVAEYTNSHMDKTDEKQITVHDVYVVWSCKTLQNSKALLSTTVKLDTTPPTIKSVTLTPNPVDAGKTFIISVDVTD